MNLRNDGCRVSVLHSLMRIIIIHIVTAIHRINAPMLHIDRARLNLRSWWIFALASSLALGAVAAYGQETETRLVIRGHKFEPAEVTVPAGKKVKLIIENQDDTAEEFESYELNREKVVAPRSQIIVYVGPLKPGRYPFFGDFHKDTAQGVLIAK